MVVRHTTITTYCRFILDCSRGTVAITLTSSTDGSIRIDYGYINRPKQDLQDGASSPEAKFHTRQITFPILFTVYHTLEPHSLDLVRLLPSSSDRDRLPSSDGQQANPNDDLKRLLHEQSQLGSCLFELSVRNVYGVPFEVSLEREGKSRSRVFRIVSLCLLS